MNIINFKANYIKSMIIQKQDGDEYKPFTVSFVEFDKNNNQDVKTIRKTAKKWGPSFADGICSAANLKASQNNKFYGIVLPQDSYQKISPKNVLGLSSVHCNPRDIFLDYLQVSPKNQNESSDFFTGEKNKKNIEYKYIGTAILDGIKEVSKGRSITVMPTFSAIEFYMKNGFKSVDDFLFMYDNKNTQ